MKKMSALHWGGAKKRKNEYDIREHIFSSLHAFLVETLMLLSALFMWYDVFPEVRLSAKMTAVLILALLVGALIGHIPRRWVVPVCSLIFAGVFVRYFFSAGFFDRPQQNWLSLEDGWLYLGKNYLEKFNSYYDTMVFFGNGKEAMAQTSLFAGVLMAVCLLWIFSGGGKRKGVYFALPAIVLTAELLVGKSPKIGGLALLVFCVALMRLYSPKKGSVGRREKRRNGKKDKRAVLLSRAAALLLTAAVLLAALTAGRLPANKLAENGWRVKNYQKLLEKRVTDFSLGNWYSGSQEVDNRMPQYSGDTVLTLHLDHRLSQNLYLRDFYGTDYGNGTWVCSTAEFEDACKAAGMDEKEFEAGLFADVCVRLSSSEENNTIFELLEGQISYDANGTAAPLPYLSDLPKEGSYSLYGDAGVQKGFFEDSLSVEFALADLWDLNQLLVLTEAGEQEEFYEWYNSYALVYAQDGEEVPEAKEWADEILDTYSLGNIGLYFPSYDGEENSYEDYPISAWDGSIQGALQTDDPWQRNLGRLYAAERVRDMLEENCSYGLNLPDAGETDSIAFFLSESHLGYCKHFASAGVLILRQIGVPARYATGYIVKQGSLVEDTEGGYIAAVEDRSAHAWVEIYLDNIGWVPVEMTPGYETKGAALPTDEESTAWQEQESDVEEEEDPGEEESQSTQKEEETEEDTERAPEDSTMEQTGETEEEEAISGEGSSSTPGAGQSGAAEGSGTSGAKLSGTGKFRRNVLCIILAVCLLALCLAAVIWLIRKRIRKYEQILNRDIKRKRYAKAVKRINRRIFHKLRRQKKAGMGELRDADYEKALIECFPQIKPQDWKDYMVIARKAAYSGEEPDEEEAKFCHRIYCELWKKQI